MYEQKSANLNNILLNEV